MKTVTGTVVSDKMDKTITVREERMVKHPLYGKYVRRATVYKAHDEANQAEAGDRVEILFTRPISKSKQLASAPGRAQGARARRGGRGQRDGAGAVRAAGAGAGARIRPAASGTRRCWRSGRARASAHSTRSWAVAASEPQAEKPEEGATS